MRTRRRDQARGSRPHGQSTLEYAVLIAVVAAALIAMETYVQRAVQAHVKNVEEELNAATAE